MDDLNELKRRAGIVTEQADPRAAWTAFTRAASDLERALKSTAVDTQGGGRAPEGQLNPLQVGDIEHHLELVKAQLDRLDQVYQWRKYMDERRARVKIT